MRLDANKVVLSFIQYSQQCLSELETLRHEGNEEAIVKNRVETLLALEGLSELIGTNF